jgi:hypothetical protein
VPRKKIILVNFFGLSKFKGMKNGIKKPVLGLLAILFITPLVGLILSASSRNLEPFCVSLVQFFLPALGIFILLIIYNVIVYFIEKGTHGKNKNSGQKRIEN